MSNRPKSRQSLAHLPSSSASLAANTQNATVDLSSLSRGQAAQPLASKRKARGKSLGPGGLEALKQTSGNIVKTAAALQVKSILKPTVPLTPPKNIPSFDELRRRSARQTKSPGKDSAEELLIDFSTPGPSRDRALNIAATESGALADPFSPVKQASQNGGISTRADDEDAERRRQVEKKEILERRAARRKSMANRRVSFAPEATLHTWSVMELLEESTTSSAANSTRRQSTMTSAQSPVPKPSSDPIDPPSTPPEQVDEPLVQASPAHQRDLHQKKRRRSSERSLRADVGDIDVFSSSPSGDVTTESSPVRVEDSGDSESDTDGDTAMSMDEPTSNTINSQASGSSTHSSLDERLRQAATVAGTRGIAYDEHGDDDQSMDLATTTVTKAFQPWLDNKQQNSSNVAADDQENRNPFDDSPLQQPKEEDEEIDDTQGMTMEMTKAVGGILGNTIDNLGSRRKSVGNRRRSSNVRRIPAGEDSSADDESMEFTMIDGGILSNGRAVQGDDDDEEQHSDAEVTMDFTTAVGGLRQGASRRESLQSMVSEENETMDITAAVGGILEPIEERTEPQSDYDNETRTIAMEMTRAVGQIIATARATKDEETTTDLDEVNYPQIGAIYSVPSSEQLETVSSTPLKLTSVASDTGSPSLALKPRLSARSRSTAQVMTTTSPRAEASLHKSPNKGASTPTKQMTPLPTRSMTPERTPVAVAITHRSASPRKLFQSEIKARASPGSAKKASRKSHDLLFSKDETTGQQTPRVVLHAPKPHQHLRRRSSGIGIDKEGVGSPRVSELLNRRTSIGETAASFKLNQDQKQHLRFEDPVQVEREIDNERAEEQRRESGRFIMEQEANEEQDENATLQLRDMIESMTPKKDKSAKIKGRKSLAVGSARGLLGKRPVELDAEEDDTPKRLKIVSREGSPVKKIHLPNPPSAEETTGRLTRVQQLGLESLKRGNSTPVALSPSRHDTAQSPQHTGYFKDMNKDNQSSIHKPDSFENRLDNVVGAIDINTTHPAEKDQDKISLQQFLSMTNIHFIELSTTKRRQTLANVVPDEVHQADEDGSDTMQESYVTAATTIPLLDLYQHATRELKSYISSGRKIIRSIEADTLAEQPALFREYVEAHPDIKAVMDNQFRNGKTNARLQSKESWYIWRSQLVDGLRDGLEGIKSDLVNDLGVLQQQQAMLDSVVPALTEKRQALKDVSSSLQQRLTEMESIDVESLKAARAELRQSDQSLKESQALLESLQQQMLDKDELLIQAAELRTEMRDQIEEANRVREENRGWPVKEVNSLKANVDSVGKQTGWKLISAEEDEDVNDFGIGLILEYKERLRLFFYPMSYQATGSGSRRRSGQSSRSISSPTASISLTYIQPDEEIDQELSTELRFFLQLIRAQLHTFSMMPKGSVSTKTVLNVVSQGWDTAQKVSEEIRLLSLAGLTKTSIRGDEKLATKLMLMIAGKGRVDIEFTLTLTPDADGTLSTSTSVLAATIHGSVTKTMDASKLRKIQDALTKEIQAKNLGEGSWLTSVHSFQQWQATQTQQTKSKSAAPPASPVKATIDPPALPMPQSPVAAVKRSPLTSKKTSTIQRKALPVPTSRSLKIAHSTVVNTIPSQSPTRTTNTKIATDGKENDVPTSTAVINAKVMGNEVDDVFGPMDMGAVKPAMPPEVQEAMMYTPIKRVGALRRSPI